MPKRVETSFTFTVDTLRAAYDFQSETPPFSRWNLPEGDEVVFHVIRDPTRFGKYQFIDGKHHISLSSSTIGRPATLLRTMAHEKIHMYEEISKTVTKAAHSRAYRRWALEVCDVHGFDPKEFC